MRLSSGLVSSVYCVCLLTLLGLASANQRGGIQLVARLWVPFQHTHTPEHANTGRPPPAALGTVFSLQWQQPEHSRLPPRSSAAVVAAAAARRAPRSHDCRRPRSLSWAPSAGAPPAMRPRRAARRGRTHRGRQGSPLPPPARRSRAGPPARRRRRRRRFSPAAQRAPGGPPPAARALRRRALTAAPWRPATARGTPPAPAAPRRAPWSRASRRPWP